MSGHDDTVEWQLVNRVQETPNTYTYTFLMDKRTEIFPGQFVTIGTVLKRPTLSDGVEECFVERAYSIASSTTRGKVDLTIKSEKPYGHINPKLKKADGFAAYFQEQIRIGDKVTIKISPKKDHFLAKIAVGNEKNIAYWSGANGAESARSLIQYMEDKPEIGLDLTLFYSNPHLYVSESDKTVNVIYYDWLIEKAKKMESFRVVFTFTRDNQVPTSDHPRIIHRSGRFFVDPDGNSERTLTKYFKNPKESFNPICGSSGFITGVSMDAAGRLEKRRGIMQELMEVEGVTADKIDKEQFYLDQSH